MFVLHALWRADDRLALWAEDSDPPARAPLPTPVPSSPEAETPHPAVHPGAAPATVVTRLLADMGPEPAGRGTTGTTALLLPTRGGGPLPSPELRHRPRPGVTTLEPWTVPSLLLPPGDAARLLGELAGSGLPDVPYGASLRWLTAVHDLAWRMVGRGQVLPALVTENGLPHARWRPVSDEAVRRCIAALVAGAPPVCRAEYPGETASGGDPGGRDAAGLVAVLLDVLADQEARAVLDDTPPLLPVGRGRRPATTAGERWVAALSSPGGRITGADPVELAALGDRLTAWHRSEPSQDGPWRVCFRLAEPLGSHQSDPRGHPSDDQWRLEFLLQSVDEPSLLVEATELWTAGPVLTALERKAAGPQEALLTGLDRAGRAYPPLRRALHTARPAELGLDRSGAIDFLRDAAPALTEAGFGVLLPAWWQHRAVLGLSLTARTAQPGTVETRNLVDRDAIVAFRWQAALGDEPLTEQELTELAAAREPLVRLRGQWVEVDPARISAALAFLERDGSGTMTAGEVLRIAAESDPTAGGVPVTDVRADGPLGELLSGRAAQRLRPAPTPAGFGGVLRPYQERGLAWLTFLTRLGLGAVLADDMGLGKTAQALALLVAEHEDAETGRSGGPTLLVCPMSLVGNWQRETAVFAPTLRVHVHHGARRLSGAELREAVSGADLVITTYGLVQRDTEALAAVHWRRVIADEAQHIKNTATRQARAIRALPAGHRIALTGTPVENRLADLHAVLDFTNPGLFGSAARFKERWSVPVERDGDEAVAAALQRRTRPFVLRRLKSDPEIVRDLPAKQEMTVLCNLTAEQAGLYRAVTTDLLKRVRESRGLERKGLVLSALGKLKQICNHPEHFLSPRGSGSRSGRGAYDGGPLGGRSGKLARLEETLEEALTEGDKTLCFTQFAEFGGMLRGYLPERLGTDVLFLHGGVSQRARDEMVDRFQDPSGPSVFLLSLKAGGIGLNLTAANQVIHVDRWWNPAVEEQATDRAFRIGQRRDVQVRKFVCVGTVEERIDAMIEAKRALAEAVVGSGEDALTELSAEALRELVSLSPEAVSE